MKLFNRIYYFPIDPDSISFWLIYWLFYLAYKTRLLKPNKKIHYVESSKFILVLTPLAGASSIRSVVRSVKKHNMSQVFNNVHGKQIFVLYRDDNLRAQSFYNKKVRNPTSLAKIRLLASCPPLNPETSVTEFKNWMESMESKTNKDKHLFSTKMVAEIFGSSNSEVRFLSIVNDRDKLENLLKVSLDEVVNSSTAVAAYKKTIKYID